MDEEQWAGKLLRALDSEAAEQEEVLTGNRAVDLARLQEIAGLSLDQIRRAIAWLDR